MIELIRATDLDDAWFQALHTVMQKGRKYLVTSGSCEGSHRIGMPLIIEINNPGKRPLAPIIPEGSSAEPPTTEEKIQQYGRYVLTPERYSREHYTYGEDLWWQIEWVIKHFQEKGHGNNHCYMTVGRPETLYYYNRDIDYKEAIIVKDHATGNIIRERIISNEWNKNPKDQPSSQCLRGIDVWIDEENKIWFWVYFRSWDLYSGFPENLGGFQLAKEYMAECIGVKDGGIIASCKDLHVYEHAWLVALIRLRKDESFIKSR